MDHGLATKRCIDANGDVGEMFPRPGPTVQVGSDEDVVATVTIPVVVGM